MFNLDPAAACKFTCTITVLWNSPMQTRVAGFGVQVPFGDTPSDVHTAVIFAVGTNPVLYTPEEYPSTTQCAWDSHNEPFSGVTGVLQVTGRNLKNLK